MLRLTAHSETQGRLAEIRSAGFDFVRINIDPTPLFYATDAGLAKHLKHIKFAVRTSLEAGLNVALDIHVSELIRREGSAPSPGNWHP